jgi:hypothetical protein
MEHPKDELSGLRQLLSDLETGEMAVRERDGKDVTRSLVEKLKPDIAYLEFEATVAEARPAATVHATGFLISAVTFTPSRSRWIGPLD